MGGMYGLRELIFQQNGHSHPIYRFPKRRIVPLFFQ
jgi:hypothetical protein